MHPAFTEVTLLAIYFVELIQISGQILMIDKVTELSPADSFSIGKALAATAEKCLVPVPNIFQP